MGIGGLGFRAGFGVLGLQVSLFKVSTLGVQG